MAWQKGQSGNPKGRAGPRQELGDAFLRVVRSDWETHGAASVIGMREKDPVAYCRMIAALLPNESKLDVRQHIVTESVSEEQARTMAEEFIESTRAGLGKGEPHCLHQGDAAGLPASEPAPEDSARA